VVVVPAALGIGIGIAAAVGVALAVGIAVAAAAAAGGAAGGAVAAGVAVAVAGFRPPPPACALHLPSMKPPPSPTMRAAMEKASARPLDGTSGRRADGGGSISRRTMATLGQGESPQNTRGTSAVP
jgi:hypothetical protein